MTFDTANVWSGTIGPWGGELDSSASIFPSGGSAATELPFDPFAPSLAFEPGGAPVGQLGRPDDRPASLDADIELAREVIAETGRAPSEAILEAADESDVLAFGEQHVQGETARSLLTDNLEALREKGYTKIFVESTNQSAIDAYMEHDTVTPELPNGEQPDYLAVLDEAKRLDIEVFAVDADAQELSFDVGIWDLVLDRGPGDRPDRDEYAADKIRSLMDDGDKGILLYGSAHLGENGVDERPSIPQHLERGGGLFSGEGKIDVVTIQTIQSSFSETSRFGNGLAPMLSPDGGDAYAVRTGDLPKSVQGLTTNGERASGGSNAGDAIGDFDVLIVGDPRR